MCGRAARGSAAGPGVGCPPARCRPGYPDTGRQRAGQYLLAGLRELTTGDDRVAEVRGAGLFPGVDLVTERHSLTPDSARAAALVNALRERRTLISVSGPAGNVLKIRPPLPFTIAHDLRGIAADLIARLARGGW